MGSDAQSDARPHDPAAIRQPDDAELTRLIQALATLPPAVRARIIAAIDKAR